MGVLAVVLMSACTVCWLVGLTPLCTPAQASQTPGSASLESLVRKAETLVQAGQYDAALQAAQEAVAVSEAATGGSPPLTARAYRALGLAQAYKQSPEAEAALRRALSICEAHFGGEHPEVAHSLAGLALFYRLRGDYRAAEPLYRRALEVMEKTCAPEHPDLAAILNSVALFYKVKGDYTAAEPLYRRALAIREKALGAEHPDTAATLNNLAELLRARGDYAAAELLYYRARAVWEKTLGAKHPHVATVLTNLALLHKDRGDYRRAENDFRQALTLREAIFGPEHPEVATAASNLAELYRVRGDYAAAEPLYRRAVAIREQKLGPEHPELAISFNNMAAMYRDRGDYATAEPLYQRALSIWEKALGPNHPLVAHALNNLGDLCRLQERLAAAKSLFEQALRIREKALGETHPLVASTLANLGAVESALGDDAAEATLKRALNIAERTAGLDHPLTASVLTHLGWLYQQRGDYAGAEALYQRSYHIREKALDRGHPDLALSAGRLAWLDLARGRPRQAGDWLARVSELLEADFRRNLVVGSERQKTLYVRRSSQLAEATVAWQVKYFPKEGPAARLALLTIWRHKGRALDVLAHQTAVLRARADPDDQRLLDDLEAMRNRLTQLAGKAESQVERARLEREIERQESKLGERFTQLGAQLQTVSYEAVRAALPKDAVLIEYFVYRPLDPERPGRLAAAYHLAAYVLSSGDGAPRVVELGALEAIASRIETFRWALQERRPDVRTAARALDEKLFAPLRPLPDGTRRLFIAPDGDANLIPFEALVDEQGRYLVERYTINLLTSGRDLARIRGLKSNTKTQRGLVLADPRYDLGGGPAVHPADGLRSVDFQLADYPPLPGTRREASLLQGMLHNIEVVFGDKATEAHLKATRAPWCLHVATHGFFLPGRRIGQANVETRELGMAAEGAVAEENPLLRSGLVLAGVRQGQSGAGEDGILTALEAAGLDLMGTQLVVFSACETGLGEARPGEGVYGLRRALVVAGAETQVMSLWKVSDAATTALMGDYYRRLARGEGRADALRATRLKFLRGDIRPQTGDLKRELGLSSSHLEQRPATDWRHPYYWAAFVVSGDWRPLDAGR
ncbi:MAG: CHAT domain-containing protein [Chloracidobacterium sp.]|nr:CHAT domain-containing protein [Chloracidobacterium sp.]MDW8216874.1 CHAT domain-containing tetratricopeptide repeat protein [Acidobacteriota bacterium]